VAVEVLAERLGVKLKDYAVGGAKSGYGNADDYWLEGLKNTGIQAQVEQYKGDLNGKKADPEALYFLQASTNDFLGDEYTYDEKAVNERADQAVANLVTAVTNLAELGARHFLVGKSADLARLPLIRMMDLIPEAKTFQDLMNAKLITEMARLEQQLNIKIHLFDYSATYDRIWSNPDQYGFTNLEDNCLVTVTYQGMPCNSPDEYFWWDIYSLTRRAHQVIAEAMTEQLSK
jgi:phospholipase/lecithinase/hemolysin